MVSSRPPGLNVGTKDSIASLENEKPETSFAVESQEKLHQESEGTKASRGGSESRVELRINGEDALSFVGKENRAARSHRLDDDLPAKSQSGPSSLSTVNFGQNSNSDSSESSSISENKADLRNGNHLAGEPIDYAEISYEGFGFARSTEGDLEGEGTGLGDRSSSASSPTGPNSLTLKSTSPSSTIGRHSWLRTSLRRTPPCSGRQRQLGSNALASQLYRSGSFNSSGRGSTCDAVDDMYSDVSLEDDVIDLNNRVRMIQEQMHVLTDTRSVGEERYARVKQENATLQARILMLEEAAKDAEARAEEKLEMEQRRHREWACRLEREKQLQLENYAIKMQTVELESSSLRDQIGRLRQQVESAREDRTRLEDVVQELRREITEVREAERQALLRANEARVLLDAAKEELAIRADDRLKLDELLEQVRELRDRNKMLEESRDELQAAAALHAGRELLLLNLTRPGYEDANATDEGDGGGLTSGGACSLAAELSADATRDLNSSSRTKTPHTMAEMRQALKEQQEVNAKLRAYIDNILLNIVENYPQLLEVKQQ